MRYDFNHDHQEGKGYHGDGLIWRYPEVSYQRVADIPSGMVIHDGRLYFANTGVVTVESVALESGRVETVFAGWARRTERNRVGPGVIDWQHIPGNPGNGEDPANIDAWIAALGNGWIRPQEILSEYAYVYDVAQETFFRADWLTQPSALAADDTALYVADYGSGWLAALDWQTGAVIWRHQTIYRRLRDWRHHRLNRKRCMWPMRRLMRWPKYAGGRARHNHARPTAVCGQVAGAFYGEAGIPKPWLAKLSQAAEIGTLAEALQRLTLS